MATHSKSLIKSRFTAFERQDGRCFYCDYPMWRGALEPFAHLHSITPGQARQLQCTAEHLVARQDGGKDGINNIVAACWACNQRRHKRKCAPEPTAYRALVQGRISRGGWHPGMGKLNTAQLPRC